MSTTPDSISEENKLGVYYPAAAPARTGPILAATDRSEASFPALRAAAILNRSLASGVNVVAVVEPLPVIVPEPTSLLQPLVITPEVKAVVRQQALEQVARVGAEASQFSVDVREGRPANEIAEAARKMNASLVVVGFQHRGIIDRLIDGETALELLREIESPVLLAKGDFELPRSVVVAVDFSPESMEAAKEAIRFVHPEATIHLAHVRPDVTIFDGSGLWQEEYEKVAVDQLQKFKQTLAAPSGMRVEITILAGNPVNALVDYAGKADAGLIVCSTRGTGMMRRIFIGSVATGLIHKSHTSILVVPPSKR